MILHLVSQAAHSVAIAILWPEHQGIDVAGNCVENTQETDEN
jgi:hypothetical protein